MAVLGRRRKTDEDNDGDPGFLLGAAVREFGPLIPRWARDIYAGLSPADVEDVTGAVFLVLTKVLYGLEDRPADPDDEGVYGGVDGRDRHRFRDGDQLGAFLRQTTRYVTLNLIRAQQRGEPRGDIEVLLDKIAPDDWDEAEHVEQRRFAAEVLGRLPPRQRDALAYHLEGYKPGETARLMGVAPRTLYDLRQQAIKKALTDIQEWKPVPS